MKITAKSHIGLFIIHYSFIPSHFAFTDRVIVSPSPTALSSRYRALKQALDAYCGGFISIGKLSDVMGMNLLSLRTWLDEHEIRQNTAVSPQDADHA